MSNKILKHPTYLIVGIFLSIFSTQSFAVLSISFSGTAETNQTITLQATGISCGPSTCGTVPWTDSEMSDTFSSNPSVATGTPGNETSTTTLLLSTITGSRTITVADDFGTATLTINVTAPVPTPTPIDNSLEEKAQAENASQQTTAVIGTIISAVKTGNSTITTRQQKLHSGHNSGFDLSGLKLNIDEKNISLANIQQWMAAEHGGGAGDDRLLFGDKLGVFVTGNFVFGEHDRTSRETGFDFNILGMMVGADYKLSDELFLGSAFQYAATDMEYDQSGGGLEADTYSFMVYSSYNHSSGFYLDGMLRYGWSDYRLNRNFTIAGQGQRAKADYEGYDYSASLNSGFEFSFGNLSIQPFGRFEYVAVDIDSYREKAKSSGATGSILKVNQQSQQAIITALGTQASYAISTSFGVILPTLSAEWIHEYKNNSRTLKSHLINNSSATISSKTNNPDRNYINLSAGVATVLTHGISGFLNYEILLANHYLTQHTFNLGMRMEY